MYFCQDNKYDKKVQQKQYKQFNDQNLINVKNCKFPNYKIRLKSSYSSRCNFTVMNKQKKLKLVLSSFKEKELIKFFQSFLDAAKTKFYKSIKQISFSCFQSTCKIDNYVVNGYGKSSSQALVSGINNLIDSLVQQEQYSEVMRNCLKKFSTSTFGLANNGSTSKKQLLSTQKAIKTQGAEPSISLEKKVLTMSGSMSSNSKNSSSKAKSIKDEIFEYFNLENLKVKNPNQAFSTISPMAANQKNLKNIETNQIQNIQGSKQKYGPNQVQQNPSAFSTEKQLEQIYKRIREVKQQISNAEKENLKLKQQVQTKKKVTLHTEPSSNQYFTRPSIENKQMKKVNPSANTQSSKKLSYLQMSLNDKLLMKGEKDNYKKGKAEGSNENQFQNVEISANFKNFGKTNEANNTSKAVSGQNFITKASQQRKFLVDISNVKTEGCQIQKNNDYTTFNQGSNKLFQFKQSNNAFQTVNCHTQINQRQSSNSILYSKAPQQQQSLSIIDSTKKLRSFSVQNSLNEKAHSYGLNSKNPNSTVGGAVANMNASFDNGSGAVTSMGMGQKKIKIPKLNLQILPNYHGKSNKSLNQSLMQNYEKKNQMAVNQ